MKIEIKNIKLGPGSEETIQYTADLYLDGKKIAYIDNAGKGAMTDLAPYEHTAWPLITSAEEQCKAEALAKDPEAFTCDGFLNDLADEIACDLYNKKIINSTFRKLDKACIKAIVIVQKDDLDKLNAKKVADIPWSKYPYKIPIASIPEGQLRASLLRIRMKLKKGEIIYNKNIPQGA